MATAVENTPKWFDAEFYLTNKLAALQETEPSANWTREMVNKAFVENGFSNPYDHYLAFGDMEGLNPNKLFDATEYVAAKAAQLGSTWTTEMVRQNIKDAGMTLAEHYAKYGFMEGLNPSSDFDQNKYLDAKLEQLLADDPKGEWTLAKVRESFLANGITPLEHYMVYGKIEGLQDPKYDYSVNGSPIPHPGSDIALTTGTDEVGPKGAEGFMTSSRDDLITGVVSSTSSKGTLNNTDVIDGAEGRDVLKLDMQSDFGGFKDGAGVKNVETIMLDNAGGHTFNAKGVEGAGQYVVDLGAKTAAIKNVDTAATAFVISGDKGAKLNVQFTDAALAGKSDVSHVVLNSVGEDDGAVEVKVGGATAAAKLESLVLHSNGTGNFVTVAGEHDAVSVMGDADITLATGANLKTFDASAAFGDVKANLSSSSATVTSVLGGAGDDTVIVPSLKSGAVLNGGEGDDTLRFEGITTGVALKHAISDFETFVFTEGSAAAANVIDMANVTGLTSIKYEGDSANPHTNDSFEVKHSSVSDFTFEVKNLRDSANPAIFHDPGTLAQVKYDGSGSLNLMLDSEGGTAKYSGFNQITANEVSSLNLSSANETAAFWVSNITAKSVETLNMDTTGGKAIGVYVNHADTAVSGTGSGNLSALTSIVAKGDGEAAFAASGTEKALTSIDVTGLTGAFTLQLDKLAAGTDNKGVEIHMGNGGTDSDPYQGYGMLGSKGNDTFYLGSGEETIRFNTNYTTNGKDTIIGFGSDDELNLSVVNLTTTTANAKNSKVNGITTNGANLAADNVFYVTSTSANAADSAENAKTLLDTLAGSRTHAAVKFTLVVADSDSTGVFTVDDAVGGAFSLKMLGTVDAQVAFDHISVA